MAAIISVFSGSWLSNFPEARGHGSPVLSVQASYGSIQFTAVGQFLSSIRQMVICFRDFSLRQQQVNLQQSSLDKVFNARLRIAHELLSEGPVSNSHRKFEVSLNNQIRQISRDARFIQQLLIFGNRQIRLTGFQKHGCHAKSAGCRVWITSHYVAICVDCVNIFTQLPATGRVCQLYPWKEWRLLRTKRDRPIKTTICQVQLTSLSMHPPGQKLVFRFRQCTRWQARQNLGCGVRLMIIHELFHQRSMKHKTAGRSPNRVFQHHCCFSALILQPEYG